MAALLFEDFVASWSLIPASCTYEQGDPPLHAVHRISWDGEMLTFAMHTVPCGGGPDQQQRFSGVPDGVARAFAGGTLADAMAVCAPSERELTTKAYWKGEECMVAQRQLDSTGTAMRLIQLVRFAGGSSVSNVSVYKKNSQPS